MTIIVMLYVSPCTLTRIQDDNVFRFAFTRYPMADVRSWVHIEKKKSILYDYCADNINIKDFLESFWCTLNIKINNNV